MCDERGIFLFEDAAHAHGSSFGDRMAGTFGIAGSFSFYPTKVMAGGEGGIILTDDDTIAAEARHLPRPGQGELHRERAHAPRLQLADE